MRGLFGIFLMLLAAALPARAADSAYPIALGFSADGTRFAFAEHGQQDGSGFSYAAVFVIDLARDTWIEPPIRVLIRDEMTPANAGLWQALDAARPALERAGITVPARVIHALPFGLDRDRDQPYRFVIWHPAGPPHHEMSVSLRHHELPADGCYDATYGFSLHQGDMDLYRDTRLSKSRGCPEHYDIQRAYFPDTLRDPPFVVTLIGVYRHGFEGLDMRHIAVPLPFRPDGPRE